MFACQHDTMKLLTSFTKKGRNQHGRATSCDAGAHQTAAVAGRAGPPGSPGGLTLALVFSLGLLAGVGLSYGAWIWPGQQEEAPIAAASPDPSPPTGWWFRRQLLPPSQLRSRLPSL